MIKIERSHPAPSSLALKQSHNSFDVIERLYIDFHEKCYICGLKGLQDPEVEHLLPHKNGNFPERRFDWNNLYLSCGHCNNVKSKAVYDEKILDCCTVDPEENLIFRLNDNNVEVKQKVFNEINEKTSQLINEVFNLKNTGLRVEKSKHRIEELQKEMNILYKFLEKYIINPNSSITLRTLKAILKKESAFSEFKRSYVRENIVHYPKLAAYI
ncbi:MAG: HNH endonuclease [Cetobacterium sp.]|uniref:HNH endonuclease n=1 Tax=Cetobacterium sp. TaxID=2071632 RepID=UPI0025BB3E1C|nr:HNH endonuclease [Cetobacterium sp.]